MYIAITENNIYRGYIGSYAGNAEDVDFGTGTGNTTGRVHLTIQGTPRLTVTATGSVDVTNELTRNSKTGSANLLPICYGNIGSTGFVNSGSSNFTVNRISTGWYEITITGEAYQFQLYTAVVTAIGTGNPIIVSTGSGGGKLHVSTYNISGVNTDANFHFVVYKLLNRMLVTLNYFMRKQYLTTIILSITLLNGYSQMNVQSGAAIYIQPGVNVTIAGQCGDGQWQHAGQ